MGARLLPKLKELYIDCLLPELVDPRHLKGKPLGDPYYVTSFGRKSASSAISTQKSVIADIMTSKDVTPAVVAKITTTTDVSPAIVGEVTPKTNLSAEKSVLANNSFKTNDD